MKKIILGMFLFTSLLVGQEGKFGFLIEGGMNFPTGDFDNYYNATFSGAGGIFYNFSETGRVSATIGYGSWSLDLDALNEEVKNSGNTGSYNVEAPITAIPILINVKYLFKTELSIIPFVLAEGGIYKITRELYGKYINEDGISNNITSRYENRTDGSINLGLGVEYPINEIINFDITARYHYLLNEETYNLGDVGGYASSYSTTNFASVTAGITVFFE